MATRCSYLGRQEGAVLAVATIVLLAVAALGIGMAVNNRYQMMMAANHREKMRAFYAADGVITMLAQEVLNGNKGKYMWFTLTNGIVGVSGSDPVTNGTYTRNLDVYRITGKGSGIRGSLDGFQYAGGKGAGPLDIVARVDSVKCPNTATPASAGIMVRQNTGRDTLYVAVSALANDKGIEFRVRDRQGVASRLITTLPSFKPPIWLRLKREGQRFSAYFSKDGLSYLLLGSSVVVTMVDSVHVGLYATSADNSNTCTAQFSDMNGFPSPLGTDTLPLGNYDVRYEIREVQWREFQISATAYKRGAATTGAFTTTLNQYFVPAMATVAKTPDSVIAAATFFDFHNDGSCPEFGCYWWLWGNDNTPCAKAESTLARRLGPDGLPQPGPGRNCRRMWGADRLWKAWPQYTGSETIKNRQRPSYWYNGSVVNIDTLPAGSDTVYKNVRVDTFLVFRNVGGGMYRFMDLFFMPLKRKGFKAVANSDRADCRIWSWPAYGRPPEWARCDRTPGCELTWKNWTFSMTWGSPWSNTDAPNSHWRNCGCAPSSIFASDCDANPIPGLTPDSTNFCFTSLIRTRFVFERGLKFKFAGDDDVWVFIDSTLVMDNSNGGERVDSVLLDNLGSLGVNLIPDSSYDFLFLHIERMPCGSSVNIETNIKLWLPPTTGVRRFKRDYGVFD